MSNILHKIKLEREKQLSEEKKILSKPSLIKALKKALVVSLMT